MDDPQVGRFWQIDPLSVKYVYNSTYAFSENKVINGIELEGLERVITTKYKVSDPNYALYQNTLRSESTNQNYNNRTVALQKAGYRFVETPTNTPAAMTLTISAGKQVGVKVGPVGVEYNGGSKEIISVSDQRLEKSDNSVTKKNLSFEFGVFGSEHSQKIKKESVKGFMDMPVTRIVTEDTYSLSLGIPKTPLRIQGDQTKTYEQFDQGGGIISNPTEVSNDREVNGSVSEMSSYKSETKGGTKFSISIGIKIEFTINFKEIAASIHN
jgi:hypothetical protein